MTVFLWPAEYIPKKRNESTNCVLLAANSLPKTIFAPAAVPYQNSFLLVGGYIESESQHPGDIYQYNAEEDEWVELESKLKTPRREHVALLVKQSLFPECS